MVVELSSTELLTEPYPGQVPGTSGLRKPVRVFKKTNYTENFIQSIFNYLGPRLENCTLILGGDGRYYCKEAAEIVIKMSAANKVGKVIVGKNAILSTPAASNIIRKYKALGGILLTASHNPGGPDQDFGIKFNTENGGPASTNITSAIHDITTDLRTFRTVPDLQCDLSNIATTAYQIDGASFEVCVIDAVKDYVTLMKEVFDFNALAQLLRGTSEEAPFPILIDCMHGVTGPYAKAIFEDELEAPSGSVMNAVPLPDFGGGHPDPNLTHATQLIESLVKGNFGMGAAFDGDGDRNMILGSKGFFVSPSDSLAILTAHAHCIPYFLKHGFKGVARSMPTSRAVDRVAKALKHPLYEVPTGWKFFSNLLDAGKISLCGEESFGTGSGHIREKDGIWAALAWLSLVEKYKKPVHVLAQDHWCKYGRDFYARHDYEDLDIEEAEAILNGILPRIESTYPPFSWKFEDNEKVSITTFENFSYTDPIDKSTVKNQGLIVELSNDCRVVFRMSGTGSAGATIRIYMERYLNSSTDFSDKETIIQPLVNVYSDISQINIISKRDKPSVIT